MQTERAEPNVPPSRTLHPITPTTIKAIVIKENNATRIFFVINNTIKNAKELLITIDHIAPLTNKSWDTVYIKLKGLDIEIYIHVSYI